MYSLDFDPAMVIELDSTTDTKFSRHLIVRVPGCAFADNMQVGALVRRLCADLVDKPPCSALFVNKVSA